MRRKRAKQKMKPLLTAVAVFFFCAFLMLYFRTGNTECLLLSAVVPLVTVVSALLLSSLFGADRLLLSLVSFLADLGVLILYRISPELGIQQAIHCLAGLAVMTVCILLVRNISRWPALILIAMAASLAMLALPLVAGKEINGAKAWLSIGGYSLQPSEPVKLALLLSVAYVLSRRQYILAILFSGLCLLLLMLQKDLGTALLYYFAVLIMLYSATGSLLLILLGLAAGAGAAVLGYSMFAHVKVRVAVWQDPWQDADHYGYQIVQGLIAMVNGGLWGMGLGQGNAVRIPEAQNDYIFAVIINEFGLVFALAVLLVYALIIVRSVMIARRSTSLMYALLAAGCAGMLGVQAFVIVGGIIKLIPLTGITLPFVSSGGSAMAASMGIAGLIQGVNARNRDVLKEDRRIAEGGSRV